MLYLYIYIHIYIYIYAHSVYRVINPKPAPRPSRVGRTFTAPADPGAPTRPPGGTRGSKGVPLKGSWF